MRRLGRLVPDETRDSLNANPTFQWFVVILMMAVGALLVYKGIGGLTRRTLTLKGGRVVEGLLAQVLGLLYVLLGAGMVVGGIYSRFHG
jgi:hypothetical protein